jgi:hypothetical protein
MTAKTGTWLIVVGFLIIFIGLCFIPAAFGNSPDKTMLGAGLAIFATGALAIAAGFYVKARRLSAQAGSAAAHPVKRSRKSNCDRCAKNEPVIQCRVHQLHLCADCLNEHYDFRSCAYIPTTRRTNARAAGA